VSPWFFASTTSHFTFPTPTLLFFSAMMDTAKSRRLALNYLAAVDKVIAAAIRARRLRDALRRKARRTRNGK
jgi:hypothetical protein